MLLLRIARRERRDDFLDPRDDSAASQEVELLSTQRLHCAMRSMSILASVIQPGATCACRSRGWAFSR